MPGTPPPADADEPQSRSAGRPDDDGVAATWEVERWLLRQGMSLMARNTRRFGVMGRALPVLVGFLCWQLAGEAVIGVFVLLPHYRPLPRDAALDLMISTDEIFSLVWLGVTTLVGLTALVATMRLRTRKQIFNGLPTTTAVVAALLVVVPLVQLFVSGDPWLTTVSIQLGFIAVVALLVSTGVAALVVWAVERAVPQTAELFRLVTRGLPLLLLLVTFLFVNTEAWQVASSLDRTRLWLVVAFFALIILVFLGVRVPDEVRRVRVVLDDDAVHSACDGTPLAGGAARLRRTGLPLAVHPLTKRERVNAVLVLVFGQATQVALLTVVVWIFFVAFGVLAIRPEVIESWVGHAPTDGTLFGVRLPRWLGASQELVQVSVLIAAFAGLNFAVAAVTDERYRVDFFEELLTDLRRLLVVREVYLNVLDLDEAAADPADPAGPADQAGPPPGGAGARDG